MRDHIMLVTYSAVVCGGLELQGGINAFVVTHTVAGGLMR